MTTAPLLTHRSGAGTWVSTRLERFKAEELASQVPVWSIVVLIVGLLICLNHGRLVRRVVMDAHFDPARFPVAMVDGLERRGIHEPIFSLDSWGGYLIYRLYPEGKVFVDDRHDFYGETYVREYLKVIHVQPGWQEVLDQLGVNLIILPVKSEVSKALPQLPTWQLISKDGVAVVFGRK
jgi:hypothetical protein